MMVAARRQTGYFPKRARCRGEGRRNAAAGQRV